MAYFKLEISWGKEQKKQTLHTDEMKGWEWVKLEVERVREMGRYKTAGNYLTAARSWTRYLGREDWVFSEMTVDKVTAYQRWLSERDICLNTISAYMRALRVMYHRAMETDYDPFAQVFTGRAKTRKRSLSPDDIQQLHALELPHGSQLALARDIFLFSFYAMGMPFVDIAYLKKGQLKDGYIHYARHKTGQRIQVALLPCMLRIIERYQENDSDYVFPILTADHSPAAASSIQLPPAPIQLFLATAGAVSPQSLPSLLLCGAPLLGKHRLSAPPRHLAHWQGSGAYQDFHHLIIYKEPCRSRPSRG